MLELWDEGREWEPAPLCSRGSVLAGAGATQGPKGGTRRLAWV